MPDLEETNLLNVIRTDTSTDVHVTIETKNGRREFYREAKKSVHHKISVS